MKSFCGASLTTLVVMLSSIESAIYFRVCIAFRPTLIGTPVGEKLQLARAGPLASRPAGNDDSIDDDGNASESRPAASVDGLLQSVIERARMNMGSRISPSNGSGPLATPASKYTSSSAPALGLATPDGLLQFALRRARSNLGARRDYSGDSSSADSSIKILESVSESVAKSRPNYEHTRSSPPSQSAQSKGEQSQSEKQYRGNPAITNTALAHALWKAILQPHVDTAIDATCGNGYDSVAMAQMLFPGDDGAGSQSTLLCIDIQQQACESTRSALSRYLKHKPIILKNNVQVLQTPHAPLPRPNDSSSVGLVAYNLGFLPRSDKLATTKMDTTVQSISDALLLVRVGGMVSVMTYPKTNPDEDVAVRLLLECMALLSSRMISWKEFMDRQEGISEEVRSIITNFMGYIQRQGDPNMSWRVSQHSKLGVDMPPTLLTATRIK